MRFCRPCAHRGRRSAPRPGRLDRRVERRTLVRVDPPAVHSHPARSPTNGARPFPPPPQRGDNSLPKGPTRRPDLCILPRFPSSILPLPPRFHSTPNLKRPISARVRASTAPSANSSRAAGVTSPASTRSSYFARAAWTCTCRRVRGSKASTVRSLVISFFSLAFSLFKKPCLPFDLFFLFALSQTLTLCTAPLRRNPRLAPQAPSSVPPSLTCSFKPTRLRPTCRCRRRPLLTLRSGNRRHR